MTPFAFADGDGVTRTQLPLGSQPAVSAVVYAATTVGLEAILLGLPTLRFQPAGRIALDILPQGLAAPTATGDDLARVLNGLAAVSAPAVEAVFGAVEFPLWQGELE